ncbi:ATP-dependent helicase HrpB [Polymorphobacter arshaanensis]|uniref:ATP-dependent helicase HrpB n=1 Tax=Glacieibacterium arshaanense TaxID=2511025 RepID=A0A4Y9EU26_9SPHN|nr:ATP-dependent helicase HrpB [Polymorphobacter arshaanensis]
MTLPVESVLPELIAALDDGGTAVLVAPPGAGKTTMVAPALLDRPWAAGKRILLLSPRRLAARAAAERMAKLRGEAVGATVGYRTRLDSKIGRDTRIEVLTEGIFTRMVQDDPELSGVAVVLFDEVHERSLEGDLGLALALDVRGALRPDLRLVAMSATLDGARYAELLDAPVIESAGRTYPVDLLYLGRDPRERIEDAMARAVHRALADETGCILAFLPGAGEIERTAERLALPAGVELHKLYGAIDPAAQRAAIAPARGGARKVVLASSIAETSLTIDGVRVVIDSGLARRPRFDRATGLTQLVTERAAQSSVTQRAGRAGRTAPGVAWRLWEKAATGGLPLFDPPEILESDLTGLTLDLACWGVADPATLHWLDAPPVPALAEARTTLSGLDAIDDDGRPTPHGQRIAKLPIPPRMAHMLVRAADHELAGVAAEVAVLLGERGLGGNDADLETRRRHWARDRGPRANAARRMAAHWARLVQQQPDAIREDAVGAVIALGYTDRVARRRNSAEAAFLMANGRAVRVVDSDALAHSEWLAVADASGSADGARLMAGAALTRASVDALLGDRITRETRLDYDADRGAVVAETVDALGAIVLTRRPLDNPDAALLADALVAAVARAGLQMLPWDDEAAALRARIAFVRGQGDTRFPDLSDSALLAGLDDWLRPVLTGKRRLDALVPAALTSALANMLDWPARQALDVQAPARFATPAGTSHAIHYADVAGPSVDVRVQELFGLSVHPTVAGVPLLLRLLSPAHRPIQTTRDLPGFWRGSWAAVKAEMKGRYPRHPWPDDPAAAPATTRTKRADQLRGKP